MALMRRAIPAAWHQYRRRNVIATLGLVAGMPCTVALAILIKPSSPETTQFAFPIVMVVWALL